MGSSFEFIVVVPEDEAEDLLEKCVKEVKRIEDVLTEFSENSETSKINQAAGIRSMRVPDEVFQLLKRCARLSHLTQGAFDISASLLKKLYRFRGEALETPDEDTLRTALRKVGHEKIKLKQPGSVLLEVPGMHIGFGAIGKGYAADRVKSMLQSQGVVAGVVNASGDLTAWGTRADGSPWKVGIADPVQPEKIMMWIPVDNQSVATSGDYEQFFEKEGIRYSHTIDPKTGRPTTGTKSVTIISSSAELSDALATAVFIMGAEVGLHFIEQLPDTHGIIVNDQNKVFTSKNLSLILMNE
jgi:thiamine biosynthesis lipoprotein